jgi:23S rRNA (adenine2503-C2)-methyltransferase
MQDFLDTLRDLGAKPKHVQRLMRSWLGAKPLDERARAADHPFPRALVEGIPALTERLARLAVVESEHGGEDGSARLLVRLEDGKTVETVLLYREGLCISSQVGCAVGCTFCMTGRSGLLRQLTSGEMVAQVARARERRTVRRVVFMGMGEPTHNLANVLEAISVLGTHGDLGHKNLVLSTVGDRRVVDRLLAHDVKPSLAISLHTTKADLRAELLPRAARIDPAELVEMAESYARAVGAPVQYQWTLIAGVNDGLDELEGIERLLRGKFGIVNFIPYNAVDGLAYERPEWNRMRAMCRWLSRRGILAKMRRSAGQDVDGACGQLRARALERETSVARA